MKINLLAEHCLIKAMLLPLMLFFMNSYNFAQINKTYVSSQSHQIQGLCLLCSVQNPQNVIGDNENNYTAMMVPIGLLANIEQTLVFPETASHFRKITIGIGTANTPVKQLPPGKIFIETFIGNTPNGDYKLVDNSMIIAEPTSKRGIIEFSPTKRFDRVKISFHSGLLNIGDELRIYYAHHLPAPFTTCGNPPLDPMAYYPFNGDLKDKIRELDLTPEDQDSAAYTNELACAQALASSEISKFHTTEPIIKNELTMAFWARMESHLYISSLNATNLGVVLDPTSAPNQLNHYVIQYRQTEPPSNDLNACLYINGEKDNCNTLINTQSINPLLITLVKGSIDELILYDRFLNEEEIKDLALSYNIPFPSLYRKVQQKHNVESNILTVSPNPTSGQITLDENIVLLNSEISIRNTSGTEVYHSRFTSKTFDLPSNLPGGVYILSVQTKDKKIYTRKIILTK